MRAVPLAVPHGEAHVQHRGQSDGGPIRGQHPGIDHRGAAQRVPQPAVCPEQHTHERVGHPQPDRDVLPGGGGLAGNPVEHIKSGAATAVVLPNLE